MGEKEKIAIDDFFAESYRTQIPWSLGKNSADPPLIFRLI